MPVETLLKKLTLEQKVRLLTGADWWQLPPEPAIGLRAVVLSDGPVGVRGTVHDETDTSANLPSATAIAATWDLAMIERLAQLLAAEARRKGVDVVLGPTVNLHRSPLGGRHFECYSEDPLLTARLGTAYVRALQACGVGATPKHYVCNDSETDRVTVDVVVDERTLREVYLRPFEDMVSEGRAWLVMAAYNSVNGFTMSEHPLLTEPLKGEWGFDGVVVSDWFAARDTVAAGRAGLDLVMPSDDSPWGEALVAAVRDGAVPESAVDEKVRRILRLAARVGALDDAAPAAPPPDPVPPAQIAETLREAAAAGTVLLTNPAGLLPIDPATVARVAVIGPHADQPRVQGGGSALVHPPYSISPLEGLRTALAGRAEVVHAPGLRLAEGLLPMNPSLVTNPTNGAPGLRAELLDADGTVLTSAHRRSGWLRFTTGDLPEGAAQLRVTARLRADQSGDWRIGFVGMGRFALTIDGEKALENTTRPEQVDLTIDFVQAPTSAVTRRLAAGQEVEVELECDLYSGLPATLGYERPPFDESAEFDRAVAAARDADVAVVVIGTTERVESEGFDRATLALPGRQDDLVRAVAAVNPRTVVVVNAGAPVLLPWRDQVGAVLLSWFGGQEMGHALADVLLGAAEPGGRLPTTWPASEADVPVLSTTPVDGSLPYAETVHVGYRAWLRAGATPAYPFGHGLGYTTWAYENLVVEGQTPRVTVRNTGPRPGKEVVQAYLSRPGSTVERPVRWLAGFAVVEAQPGEAVTVEVPLDQRSFQHWDAGWVTEPGAFTLGVGRSVLDTPLTAEVII